MAKKVKTSPVHLQYCCKTSVIDEIVCQRRGIEFDKKLADGLESTARHYFIVDKKGNFTVVSGVEFESYFNGKDVEMKDRITAPVQEFTDSAMSFINKFIKEVHEI